MNTDKTRIVPSTPPQPNPLLANAVEAKIGTRKRLADEHVTREIIGAAFEVHRELGTGFLEKVYEAALMQELASRGVECISQAEIGVSYKARQVGIFYCDLLVAGRVICEIKAAAALSPAHEAQLLNYLKATGTGVGLLINFGARRCQFKRMVF